MCFDKELFDYNPYLEHFICPIGQQVLEDPVKVNCNNIGCASHSYCRSCIVNWLLTDSQRRCPFCRTKITFDLDKLPKDCISNNVLNEFVLKCGNYEKNCQWKDKLKNYSNHIKICDYEEITCQNSGCNHKMLRLESQNHNAICQYYKIECLLCKKLVARKDIVIHNNTECELTILKCHLCEQSFIRKELNNHNNVCPETEIECSNEGCELKYKRKHINDHNYDCLHYKIKCNYCDEEIKRYEIEEHKSEDCPNVIEECGNCKQQYERYKLEQHDIICPEKLVSCELKKLTGCQIKYKNKDKDQHMSEYLMQHTQKSLFVLNKIHKNLRKTLLVDKTNDDILISININEKTMFKIGGYKCHLFLQKIDLFDEYHIYFTINNDTNIKIDLSYVINGKNYTKELELQEQCSEFSIFNTNKQSLDEIKQIRGLVNNEIIAIRFNKIKITRKMDINLRESKFIKTEN